MPVAVEGRHGSRKLNRTVAPDDVGNAGQTIAELVSTVTTGTVCTQLQNPNENRYHAQQVK